MLWEPVAWEVVEGPGGDKRGCAVALALGGAQGGLEEWRVRLRGTPTTAAFYSLLVRQMLTKHLLGARPESSRAPFLTCPVWELWKHGLGNPGNSQTELRLLSLLQKQGEAQRGFHA